MNRNNVNECMTSYPLPPPHNSIRNNFYGMKMQHRCLNDMSEGKNDSTSEDIASEINNLKIEDRVCCSCDGGNERNAIIENSYCGDNNIVNGDNNTKASCGVDNIYGDNTIRTSRCRDNNVIETSHCGGNNVIETSRCGDNNVIETSQCGDNDVIETSHCGGNNVIETSRCGDNNVIETSQCGDNNVIETSHCGDNIIHEDQGTARNSLSGDNGDATSISTKSNRLCCCCLHSSMQSGSNRIFQKTGSHFVLGSELKDHTQNDKSLDTRATTNDKDGFAEICTVSNFQKIFLDLLEDSVRTRAYNLPRNKLKDTGINKISSKVGILFSGGIDSAVITALADRCVPADESIDLINVAFEQKSKILQNVKKKHQKSPTIESPNFDVPDRITGRNALKELRKERQWNFIEVDITLEELQKERQSSISNLVYPLNSVLDDSIGCAIWFAARGVGKRYVLSHEGEMELLEDNYKSPVKVLLTGMGADEQLGGYARHRTKFESSGWAGLIDEMNMEIERISSRNLGRDDRCISDHGREARFPFLDENVVSFLQSIPPCVKCDPRLPRGAGEKILLREVAQMLGLPYASALPKRAIQFGSKIAKLESRKEKGSDNCGRLK